MKKRGTFLKNHRGLFIKGLLVLLFSLCYLLMSRIPMYGYSPMEMGDYFLSSVMSQWGMTHTLRILPAFLYPVLAVILCKRAGITGLFVPGAVNLASFCYVFFSLKSRIWFFSPIPEHREDGRVAFFCTLGVVVLYGAVFWGLTSIKGANKTLVAVGMNLLAGAVTTAGLSVYGRGGTNASMAGALWLPFRKTQDGIYTESVSELERFFTKYNILDLSIPVAVIFLCIIFYRSRTGLRLRALKENPAALSASGVNTDRLRGKSILFASLLAGLGGCAWPMVAVLGRVSGSFTEGMGLAPGYFAVAVGELTTGLFGGFSFAMLFSMLEFFSSRIANIDGWYWLRDNYGIVIPSFLFLCLLLRGAWGSYKSFLRKNGITWSAVKRKAHSTFEKVKKKTGLNGKKLLLIFLAFVLLVGGLLYLFVPRKIRYPALYLEGSYTQYFSGTEMLKRRGPKYTFEQTEKMKGELSYARRALFFQREKPENGESLELSSSSGDYKITVYESGLLVILGEVISSGDHAERYYLLSDKQLMRIREIFEW